MEDSGDSDCDCDDGEDGKKCPVAWLSISMAEKPAAVVAMTTAMEMAMRVLVSVLKTPAAMMAMAMAARAVK